MAEQVLELLKRKALEAPVLVAEKSYDLVVALLRSNELRAEAELIQLVPTLNIVL